MMFLSVCLLLLHCATMSEAQFVEEASDQCVYSFNVPKPSEGCQEGTGGNAVMEEEIRVLTESAKLQKAQITSLIAQQTLLLNKFTLETAELCKSQTQTKRELSSSSAGSGVTYIRYGRTTCDAEATALYSGYTASSYFNEGYGGGTNYLCLPEVPQWANNTKKDGFQGGPKLFGTEYELIDFPFSTANNVGKSLLQNDAPCVLCYVPTRSAQIMIPARTDCPSGWTKDYWGFLVTSHHGHQNNKDFVCLDQTPEVRTGGSADTNGALFYFVESTCTALPCPKYGDGWEISCVVCSK